MCGIPVPEVNMKLLLVHLYPSHSQNILPLEGLYITATICLLIKAQVKTDQHLLLVFLCSPPYFSLKAKKKQAVLPLIGTLISNIAICKHKLLCLNIF